MIVYFFFFFFLFLPLCMMYIKEKTKMLRFICFAHLSHAILREICIYKIGLTLIAMAGGCMSFAHYLLYCDVLSPLGGLWFHFMTMTYISWSNNFIIFCTNPSIKLHFWVYTVCSCLSVQILRVKWYQAAIIDSFSSKAFGDIYA